MGGYDPKEFTELHRNILLIASDAGAAKQRALSLVQTWTLPHKDNLYEVENLIDLSTTVESYGYHLRITQASEVKEFAFSCNFLPIGRSAAP